MSGFPLQPGKPVQGVFTIITAHVSLRLQTGTTGRSVGLIENRALKILS
jgi:hypothetical protein